MISSRNLSYARAYVRCLINLIGSLPTGKIKTVVFHQVFVTVIEVIGIICDMKHQDIASHFRSLGAEAVIFDPNHICGKDHVVSSYIHAERAFSLNNPRTRNILSETILYASGDRQIGRAIKKMGPKDGDTGFVILIIGDVEDLKLSEIGAKSDDSLIDCTEVSAKNMGLEKSTIPYKELILEHVAAVDIMKY